MAKKVKIYALSTCIWCKKTIDYFTKKGTKFDHVYVDLLEGKELEKVEKELGKLNPDGNFPTVVIEGRVIVGYQVREFGEELKK
jgi:glutaredoxin-like protein NrdH